MRKQSECSFSISLKRLIESALNVPYDPSKKPHTSSVRKGNIGKKKEMYDDGHLFI